MAISEYKTGLQTISGTEWSLSTDTLYSTGNAQASSGVYQVFADTSGLAAGNILQLTFYEKCRTGDTQRVIDKVYLNGAQTTPMFVSPSMVLVNGWDVSAKTVSGTCSLAWSVRKVA